MVGQARSTQRHVPKGKDDEERLTALLRWEGWRVNKKRVERIWRKEGLKVPRKQPRRGRLWLGDGACIHQRAQHRNHVRSYDFVADRTLDGKALRMLTLVDEHTRECLAIDVGRRLNSTDVLERLSELFVSRGARAFIRSDNGSEFTAKAVREWLAAVDVKTLYIEPGSPWQNGYVESFNGRFPDSSHGRRTNIELGTVTGGWSLMAAREGLRLLVVFVFINGSAIFLVWQTASPLPESGRLTVSGFSLPLPVSWSAMLTRGVLALCALIMVALAFLTWRAACRRILSLRRTPSIKLPGSDPNRGVPFFQGTLFGRQSCRLCPV